MFVIECVVSSLTYTRYFREKEPRHSIRVEYDAGTWNAAAHRISADARKTWRGFWHLPNAQDSPSIGSHFLDNIEDGKGDEGRSVQPHGGDSVGFLCPDDGAERSDK